MRRVRCISNSHSILILDQALMAREAQKLPSTATRNSVRVFPITSTWRKSMHSSRKSAGHIIKKRRKPINSYLSPVVQEGFIPSKLIIRPDNRKFPLHPRSSKKARRTMSSSKSQALSPAIKEKMLELMMSRTGHCRNRAGSTANPLLILPYDYRFERYRPKSNLWEEKARANTRSVLRAAKC